MKTLFNTLEVAASFLALFETNGPAVSVGDSMQVNYRYPDINTVVDSGLAFTVNPGGTSFSDNLSGINFDISESGNTITILRFQGGSPPFGTTSGFSGPPGNPNGASDAGVTLNGLVFTDFSQAFSGFTLTSVTSSPGFDSSRVAINGNDLSLNFMGINYTAGQSEVVLQTQTASSDPEGGSTLLFCAASDADLIFARCFKIGAPPITHPTNIQHMTFMKRRKRNQSLL